MNKNKEYQSRAAEFLRQWQEQMTRQMTSPDAIRAMLEAMQQFGAHPNDANAQRPTHAPDARDDAIRDLTKRLDTMEQQLRKLYARMDAAQKPARASKRTDAKPVSAGKRAMAKRKPMAKSKHKK